jgi:hypothetical protein
LSNTYSETERTTEQPNRATGASVALSVAGYGYRNVLTDAAENPPTTTIESQLSIL